MGKTGIKRIIIISILVGIALLIMTAIGKNPFLPIYQKIDNEEESPIVLVDGVRYQWLPETKWEFDYLNNTTKIGYAGSWETSVSTADDDLDRNFVLLRHSGIGRAFIPLYRTDKEIPEPSGESVDRLVWYDYNSHTIEDKAIIKELFDVWDKGSKIFDISTTGKLAIEIVCYSDEVPGFSYTFEIERSGEKLVFGTNAEGYTEIPLELLEKIAGYKIYVDMDTFQVFRERS